MVMVTSEGNSASAAPSRTGSPGTPTTCPTAARPPTARPPRPHRWRGEGIRLVWTRPTRGGRMPSTEILTDAFDRIQAVVHSVLASASPEVLKFRPDPQANTIAWLVWHLTRVQDAQISDLMGAEHTSELQS